MNFRLIFQLLGKVLLIGGALMLPAAGVALIYQDAGLLPMLAGAAAALCTGALLQLIARPSEKNLHSRDGFAVVALSWVLLGVCGALPLWLSGYFHCYADCLFEIVSGFTTTGATVLSDIEALPRSILFWRSFTHWIGGMGILVLTMALIPQMGARALHLLRAESTGPNPDKLLPRISQSAKTLYGLYIALSLVQVVVLMCCGMNFFDALMHMFSTAGTGGFSNYNTSVGHFNSPLIEIVIGVFMILFSLNFTLLYRVLHGEWKAPLRTETKVFLGIVTAATLLITLNIRPISTSFSNALRNAFFQVSSVISTTGFATADFNLWPQFSRILLLCLMVIGGCAGSTAGGIKVLRLIILCKGAGREVRSVVHPRGVHVIRMDGRALDEDISASVAMFFFCYVALAIVAILLVSLEGLDFETTVTSVLACITNTGPGLGAIVGPTGNFGSLSAGSKIVLTVCMLIGRLDIYPIMMFFTAAAWRKN